MKKTIKKRAFVSAIAMLIVSAIVLTSSTFAWFSMAKNVSIDTMQLNITSPDGIQISANTSAFTTHLTMGNFDGTETSQPRFNKESDTTNFFPTYLSPASCPFRMSGGSLPAFYTGSISDTNQITISQINDAATTSKDIVPFVAFDLFVKLGKPKTGTTTKVYWARPVADKTGTKQTDIVCSTNPDVETAMRIAFVYCGSGDATAAKTVLSGIKTNGGSGSVCMFEPDAYNHTEDSGKADGSKVATNPISLTGTITPTGNIVTNSSYIQTSYACTQVDDQGRSDAYFEGVEGINRIRVYIWMEGQDVDCANDVAGAALKVNLKFDI